MTLMVILSVKAMYCIILYVFSLWFLSFKKYSYIINNKYNNPLESTYISDLIKI